jgi:hypothetical protein
MTEPRFTRQHFQFLAEWIKDLAPSNCIHDEDGPRVADSLADALATTNPNFNRERFINAATE